jgi:hypothetical protein
MDSKNSGPAWGPKVAHIDALWTRLETRLCVWVVIAETLALFFWISLKGLATDTLPGGNAAGLICRVLFSATFAGIVAHFVSRPGQNPTHARQQLHRIAVPVGMILGGFAAKAWLHFGVSYFGNALNWLINGSVLSLVGGPRGLVTRLTLWLALLGASIATSRGKHIHIDVAARYVPTQFRLPAALLGWAAAAAVCFAASYGFIDHIAVAEFKAKLEVDCADDMSKPVAQRRSCPTSFGERVGTVRHEVRKDLFLLARQASLDLQTLPVVLRGKPCDRYLTPSTWNTWMRSADWKAHFAPEAVDAQLLDETERRDSQLPLVPYPGGGERPSGLLVRTADFLFPFGLLMIGLKFLLRMALALLGQVNLDPDAAHAEENLGADATHEVTP